MIFCKEFQQQDKDAIKTILFREIQNRSIWSTCHDLFAEDWEQWIHIRKRDTENVDQVTDRQDTWKNWNH